MCACPIFGQDKGARSNLSERSAAFDRTAESGIAVIATDTQILAFHRHNAIALQRTNRQAGSRDRHLQVAITINLDRGVVAGGCSIKEQNASWPAVIGDQSCVCGSRFSTDQDRS